MIGIVIVTHGRLGDALVETAGCILGEKSECVVSVSIDIRENVDNLRAKIVEGIKKVDNKKGVLILTDMFGGTPSNLSYSLLDEGYIEVISGVNLPVLIKAISARKKMEIIDLCLHIETFGKKSISLASGILKGRKRG
jgi:PTS system mannose-specific IIA component